MDQATMKAGLAELVGTFILVFIGGFAVASGQGVAVAALAHGFALICIIYTYGSFSGAHVNPAVTLGLLVAGKIDALKAVIYWIVQFVGAILAAFVISLILGSRSNLGETTGALTASSVWMAALFEGILTFLLVSVVFQAAVAGRAGNLAGLAIGLTLAACILAGGTYTGASLNPARTLGPALIAGNTSYLLPYLVGIFAGGAAAGAAHRYGFGE
jgi:MIP family channel proteins